MMTYDEFEALSGAYALDAVDAVEAAAIEAYLDAHPDAVAEIERLRAAAVWYGASEAVTPPTRLRDSVLQSVAAAAGSSPGMRAHVEAHRYLDAIVADVPPASLHTITANGLSIRDLVAHLAAMESLVADNSGSALMPNVGEQDVDNRTAHALDEVAGHDFDELRSLLDASTAALRDHATERETLPWYGDPLPSSTVLAFRAFETWIHAGDIAEAVGGSRAELSADSFHTMASISMHLMPGAMARRGVARPGASARVVLTGTGGGSWTVPLAPSDSPVGEPVVVIEAPVLEWCLRIGDRIEVDEFPMHVTGDPSAARELISAANAFATL